MKDQISKLLYYHCRDMLQESCRWTSLWTTRYIKNKSSEKLGLFLNHWQDLKKVECGIESGRRKEDFLSMIRKGDLNIVEGNIPANIRVRLDISIYKS